MDQKTEQITEQLSGQQDKRSGQRPGKLSGQPPIPHAKAIFRLCAVLAFAIAVFGIVRHNLAAFGSLYLQSDDGDLYLSIARNMLQNAHFIQTARPIKAFVVPPGLPAVTTLLLYVGRGSIKAVLAFQYAVYGAAAACMAVTALKLALNGMGRNRLAAVPWALSVAAGAAVPVFYVWCSMRIRHPNPGFVLTENYVVFLIALILWLVVSGADLRKITVAAFVLTLFRPACSLLLVAVLLWLIAAAARNLIAKKKEIPQAESGKARLLASSPAPHRINFYDVFVLLAVFACVIGINIGVNYVETGEIIPLEDYGNLDVFLANNEKAGPDWYHSGKVPEFASMEYYKIADNGGLTRYEQNELAGEALKEYVRANPQTVLHNAAVRFAKLFRETWGKVFWAFLACLVLQLILRSLRWPQKIYVLLMALFLAVPPAFGLLVARYSAPMLPLFIALIVGTTGQLICKLVTVSIEE